VRALISGVQFLQTSGISTELSFSLNMVLNAMFMIGTMVSWICGPVLTPTSTVTDLSDLLLRTTHPVRRGHVHNVLRLVDHRGDGFPPDSRGHHGHRILAHCSQFHLQRKWSIGDASRAVLTRQCTLGPLCYVIIGEMSSTRLRQKSIALSRIAYQIMNIICGIIVPRMLSPTAWNWGPKSGLFWGGVSGLTAIYLVLRLPETKGRSYGELDLLFERKIPAWRFKSTPVDREWLAYRDVRGG
jgi:SP family general alpha glucoside:H+ symporter-like MFS transporter